MKKVYLLISLLLVPLSLVFWPALPDSWEEAQASTTAPLPQFTGQTPNTWINSAPLQREKLQGKVVLVVVWTSI